ncbi:hypothetical protein E4N98_12485, partial [Treponema denticola]
MKWKIYLLFLIVFVFLVCILLIYIHMVGGKKNFKVTSKEMEKMKNRNLLKQQDSLTSRTAIEAEILFAVCVIKKQALTGGKSLARENKYSKKIGAKSAVLNFVFFVMLKNKIEQSAKRNSLLKNLTDRTFENRWSRYKELGKKVPQAYRVYVEDTFLPCDAGDARIFSKEQEYTTYYSYEDGYYDRETKEFYGFAKVTKRSEGGTVQETEYYNDKYYRKGMVKKSKTIYGGFTYNEKEIEVDTSPHARIIKEEVIQREKDSPYSYLKTSKRYVYDKYGNVTKLYDEGDVTKANDDITAEITYWKGGSEETYFKAHPEKIEVKDTNNKLLRKREGSYDSKTGALTQLNEFYEGGKYLKTEIEWTKEGAIRVITAPTGKRIEYKYLDGIYPIEIKEVSAKGDQTYTSTIEWDSVLGVKLKETDSANNTMTYKYDGFGRVTEVRSPYDTDKTPYAKYTYFTPKDSFWYTVTENKISTRKEDKAVMRTIVTHDGLGR